MEKLEIEATEFSPQVILSSQLPRFEISGESRPENTGRFYTPIINWLKEYKLFLSANKTTNPQSPLIFEFKFEYFNSTSAKYIMDILFELDSFRADGYHFKVKWYADALDEDMKEAGEEFSKLIEVPFEFIER
jgi:hypothetical protein